MAAAHLHPGTRSAALEGDRLPPRINAVLIEPGALAAAPVQEAFGTEATELSGRPVFCSFPGPLAVFCTLTGGAERLGDLPDTVHSRHVADGKEGFDRLIRPGLPGNALTLELLQRLGLIKLEAEAQLRWIGLQLGDQLLEPVIADRLSQLEATDEAADLGEVAGAKARSKLSGPEVTLLTQGGEMTREVAAAVNIEGLDGSGWRSCSSTPWGSRIDHLAQQERTAGW